MPLPAHITSIRHTKGTWEDAPVEWKQDLFFSVKEFQERLAGLRDIMNKVGVEAVVTYSVHNTLYYSGFWMIPFGRKQGAFIPLKGEPCVIAPAIESDRPKNMTWFKDVKIYSDVHNATEGYIASVVEALSDNGITHGRVGIEEDEMPVYILRALEKALPAFDFVDVSHGMMRQHMIKSPAEIDLIRNAGKVADLGAQTCLDICHEGITEMEVAQTAVTAMNKEILRLYPKWEVDSTWCWFQSGMTRTMAAHAPNTGRKVKKGDLLSLNCFPEIAGYYNAIERSLVFGKMSDAIRKPFEVNVEAHLSGLAAMGPGVPFADFDAKYIDPIYEKAGMLEYRTFGTGHSFGVMHYWYGREEGGENRPYCPNVMEPGMVISMEPMISVPGVGGFRHHEIVLITDTGMEQLTNFRNDIINIGI